MYNSSRYLLLFATSMYDVVDDDLIFPEPLVLHCLKMPQFLQRMEKRARDREEKHAIIRERRRQTEEERIRLKQQVNNQR